MLETLRTRLRPFQKSDFADFHAYCSQDGVGEMAGWKHHESKDESQRVLEAYQTNASVFAIEWKENGKVIGHIAVREDSESGRADTKELGFALNRDFQRRGVMTEVVTVVVRHLFSCGIQHIYACCFQENEASRRLIEKTGFSFEKEGEYYSPSLHKSFRSFEYVYHSNP